MRMMIIRVNNTGFIYYSIGGLAVQHETYRTKETNLSHLLVHRALESGPVVSTMIVGAGWPISRDAASGNSNMLHAA